MQGIQLANGRAGTHPGSETVPAVCGWVHARMHEPQVWEAWETPTHTPPFLGFSAKEGHVPRMFAGAFFLLNAGPGSFNPQPDGESCWQRRGPHIIVPFTKAHLSGSSGVGWELGWEHRPAFIPPRRAGGEPHMLASRGWWPLQTRASPRRKSQRLPPESW